MLAVALLGSLLLPAAAQSRPAGVRTQTVDTSLTVAVQVPSCITPGYTGSGVTLTWTDPTVISVQIATAADFTSFVYSKSVPAGVLSTTGPDGFLAFASALTLTPNTTYSVRTSNGTAYSAVTSFRVPSCNPAPTRPSITLSVKCLASPSTAAVATLSWSAPGVVSSQMTVDSTFGGINFSKPIPLGDTSTALPAGYAFFSSQLQINPGTTYYVRIYNGTYSPAAQFRIPLCPPPRPTVWVPACIQPNAGGSFATFSWTVAVVKTVQVATTSDFSAFVYARSVPADALSATGPDGFFFFSTQLTLNPNTVYYARTSNGSAYSAAASFKVPSCNPMPAAPKVAIPSCIDYGYTGSDVSISWSDPHVTAAQINTVRVFAAPWVKSIAVGSLATPAPTGFMFFSTQLAIDPDIKYFVRIYNGSYSSQSSFYIPNCPRPPLPSTVPVPPASATRIMPIGDSITQSTTAQDSYRRPLWFKLIDAGFNVDFVGSMYLNYDFSGATHLGLPPDPDFDLDHDGHWGWTAQQASYNVYNWAKAAKPDAALVDLGSNDMDGGRTVTATITDLGTVIDQLRKANPDVVVLLAEPTGSTSTKRNSAVQQLNAAIPGLAAQKTTAASPVIAVDQNTGFDPATDTWDGLHPNASGEEKIAARWFEALQPLLSAQQA